MARDAAITRFRHHNMILLLRELSLNINRTQRRLLSTLSIGVLVSIVYVVTTSATWRSDSIRDPWSSTVSNIRAPIISFSSSEEDASTSPALIVDTARSHANTTTNTLPSTSNVTIESTIVSPPSFKIDTIIPANTSTNAREEELKLTFPSAFNSPSDCSIDRTVNNSKENPDVIPAAATFCASAKVTFDDFPPGFKPHPNMISETYLPRSRPMTDSERQQLASQWGTWAFVDDRSSPEAEAAATTNRRPTHDYYAEYPSRDIPRSRFPPNAWQIDPLYLADFLPEALALVRRAMEAILSEYGHGVHDEPGKTRSERADMFHVELSNDTSSKVYLNKADSNNDKGGYMNYKGYNGLIRRILHSVMTEDTFRVIMGGHSAAAGHGNHFQQSYTLQMQRILEPIFARLGVTMTAHNIGFGGLGTLQSALGMRDIYGDDVDILIYDSGMTETDAKDKDLFMRQGMLSGEKVPLLWANQDDRRLFQAEIFKYLGKECDADVAVFGTCMRGIPRMTTTDQSETIAWATQYLKCDTEIRDVCKKNEYMGTCWNDRSDVTPVIKQNAVPKGRASWHPGNRFHQLTGRGMTFTILSALEKAIEKWNNAKRFILADSDWHMNEYYSNMRLKLLKRKSICHTSIGWSPRFCDLGVRGRTEFMPQVKPYRTSIRSIIKHNNIDEIQPNIYDPPDEPNRNIEPRGLDVLRIIENGLPFQPLLGRRRRNLEWLQHNLSQFSSNKTVIQVSLPKFVIQPGSGWSLSTQSAPDNCDGSYDSFCGRSKTSSCLLDGQNDYRGGLKFDGLSGWMILTLEKLEHGFVVLKIEDWHKENENVRTNGWACENNQCPETHHRLIGDLKPQYCPNFRFEFALDGNITTWNLLEWRSRSIQAQRVVQLWTLLDDPSFTERPKDVELALRITGCMRSTTFLLTHVYWA